MAQNDTLDYIGDLQLNDPNLKPMVGGSFELEPGSFAAEVVDVTKEPNKKGDAMNLVVNWEFLEGPNAGKTTKSWYSLRPTPFERGRVLNVVKALGIPIDARGGFSFKVLLGAQCMIDIEVGEYAAGMSPAGQPIMKTSYSVCNERAFEDEQPANGQAAPTPPAPPAPPPAPAPRTRRAAGTPRA